MSLIYQHTNGSAESVNGASATISARPSPLLPLVLSKADARRSFCLPGTSRRNSISDEEGEVSQSVPVFKPVFSEPVYDREITYGTVDTCGHGQSPVPGSPADSGCDCGVWDPELDADRTPLADSDDHVNVNRGQMKRTGGRAPSISHVMAIDLGEPIF